MSENKKESYSICCVIFDEYEEGFNSEVSFVASENFFRLISESDDAENAKKWRKIPFIVPYFMHILNIKGF